MPETVTAPGATTPVPAPETPPEVTVVKAGPSALFKKLQKVRAAFALEEVKKTGRNDFSKYDYFELSDFLPRAQVLFDDVGLCPVITFALDRTYAIMSVYDVDSPEYPLVIQSPMGKSEMKGANDSQNVGMAQTYVRRYLYMTLLELSEHDATEDTNNVPEIQVLIDGITKLAKRIMARDAGLKPKVAAAIRAVIGTSKYDTLKAGDEDKARAVIAALEALEEGLKEEQA